MVSARKARKCAALLRVERAVAVEDGAGDGDARGLAAAGEQRRGQLADVVLAARSRRASAAGAGGPARRCCPAAPAGKKRSRDRYAPQSCGQAKPAKLTLNYNNFATAAFPIGVRPLASDVDDHRQRCGEGSDPALRPRPVDRPDGCLAHSRPSATGETSMTTETYEILAIKYGEFTSRQRFESFIVGRRPRWPPPHRLFRLGDPQRQPHHRGRLRLRRGRGRQARPQDRAHAGGGAGDDRRVRRAASSS